MDGQVQHSYTTNNGTFYTFVVELEGGIKGQVSSKSPAPYRFNPGDEVEYTFTASANPQHLGKLKLEKPKDQPQAGEQSTSRGWSPEKECSVMVQGLLKSIIEAGIKSPDWAAALAHALVTHDNAVRARLARAAAATLTAQPQAPPQSGVTQAQMGTLPQMDELETDQVPF